MSESDFAHCWVLGTDLVDDRAIPRRMVLRDKPTRTGNMWRWVSRTLDDLKAEGYRPAQSLTGLEWAGIVVELLGLLEDH